ncbi:YraN family protein [Pseudomonas massiliensis]|uniref:YraN family protein n=1 Tax=Pseudomonas massiliensis TaxID=522492 RepID=UPI00058B29BD|nr:YraN family protein [Pseudomonas massiliensis]
MTRLLHPRPGQQAEDWAERHLQAHGLQRLARNWRCRYGELDLVMLEGDTVVFAEVRYRLHAGWGGALGSVDGRKQARVVTAAAHFLQENSQWAEHPCRFDIVAIEGTDPRALGLTWLKDAFTS